MCSELNATRAEGGAVVDKTTPCFERQTRLLAQQQFCDCKARSVASHVSLLFVFLVTR